ncbi:CAP domain-containing protein [Clostridium sp. DL1XJH146]
MSKRERVLFVIFLLLSSVALNDTYQVVNAEDFFNNNVSREDVLLTSERDNNSDLMISDNIEEETVANPETLEVQATTENTLDDDSKTSKELFKDSAEENVTLEENETANNEQTSIVTEKKETIVEEPVEVTPVETKTVTTTETNAAEKAELEAKAAAEAKAQAEAKAAAEAKAEAEAAAQAKAQAEAEAAAQAEAEAAAAEKQNTGYFISSIEQEILKYTNEERAKNGLDPVVWESSMNSIARFKAEDMLENSYFAHPTPSLGNINCLQLAQHFGYSTSSYGENLFTIGVDGASVLNYTSAQKIVDAWMNSSGHRENILRPEWKKMSAGVICSDDNSVIYAVQHFSVD